MLPLSRAEAQASQGGVFPNFWGQLAGFVQKKDTWKAMEPPAGPCSALNPLGSGHWRLGGDPVFHGRLRI